MQFSKAVVAEDPQLGLYGWRKRCFYALLLGLTVLVLSNLVATLLLINAIHFNLGGFGELTVSAKGVHLRDRSFFHNSLVTSQLSSRRGQPLLFETTQNMSAVVKNGPGQPTNSLHFWSNIQEHNRQEVYARASHFRVSDLQGKAVFAADSESVSVGADVLRVVEGGARFTGSVQTSMLRSHLGKDLMLESSTRMLYISAPLGVTIESRAADISVSCFTNLHLGSSQGKVKLRSPSIYIPNMKDAALQRPQGSRKFLQAEHSTPPKSYQVCVCTNGKLFIANPFGECRVDGDNAQCR